MGGGHQAGRAGRAGTVPAGVSLVHRLDPAAKVLGVVAFAVTVAATPRSAWPVFGVEAVAVVAVLAAARVGPATVLRRLAPTVPFLVGAALLAVVGRGERVAVDVAVGRASLSSDGLRSGGALAAKTLLGASAAVALAATTPVPALLAGLSRLRVPSVLVAIAAFMLRYVDLLTAQVRAMRTAMAARCHDPRWLWQAPPIAASVGRLFVRSYERGERVHQAMLARGFTGTLPDAGQPLLPHSRRDLAVLPSVALALAPTVAAALALMAWWA